MNIIRFKLIAVKLWRLFITIVAIFLHLFILYYRHPKAPFLFLTCSQIESIRYGYLENIEGDTVMSYATLDENAMEAMVRDLRKIIVTKPISKYDMSIFKTPVYATDVNLPFFFTLKNGMQFRLTVGNNTKSKLYILKVGAYEEPLKSEERLFPLYKAFRVALSPSSISAAANIQKLEPTYSTIHNYKNLEEWPHIGEYMENELRDYFE